MRDYLLGDRAELTDLMAWNTDSTRLPDGMHGPDVTFVLTSGGYNAGIISEPGPPTNGRRPLPRTPSIHGRSLKPPRGLRQRLINAVVARAPHGLRTGRRARGSGRGVRRGELLEAPVTMNPSNVSFFESHHWPWLILVGLALFPRLTLLFVGGPFSWLQWLGWAVAPHLLVAIMATTLYWQTNPVLCVIAWFFAFAGTGAEGKAAHVRIGRRAPTRSD